MRKKIRHFSQHTLETCGASCILMLLDYYGMITYPTPKMEMAVYTHHKVNGYKGMTGAAVANCLSDPAVALKRFLIDTEKKLDIHLVQSFEEKMNNRGDCFSREDYEKIMENHLSQLNKCRDRINLTVGLDFHTEFLKQMLTAGKEIILQCFVPETEDGPPSILHWVILERYEQDREQFRVRDPLPNGKLWHYSDEKLETLMDTPIGKICVIVGEPNDRSAL